MAHCSQGEKDDVLNALVKTVVTRGSTCLTGEELPDISEQHDEDDLKRVLAQNALLRQQISVLQIEYAEHCEEKSLLQQKCDACEAANKELEQRLSASDRALKAKAKLEEKNLSLAQALEASQKDAKQVLGRCASLQQQIAVLGSEHDACGEKLISAEKQITMLSEEHQTELASLRLKNDVARKGDEGFQFKANMRQLRNDFILSEFGKLVDTDLLLNRARILQNSEKKTREDNFRMKKRKDVAYPLADLNIAGSFSSVVTNMETKRLSLQKELSVPNLLPKDRSRLTSQIKTCKARLVALKDVAKDFETTEVLWNPSIGEGFYALCVVAAHANNAFHPPMTKDFLNDMFSRADKEEYNYVGVQMKDAVKAIITWLQAPKKSY